VARLPRRCLDCGVLVKRSPRCESCTRRRAGNRNRGTTTERGYGAAWAALSWAVRERDGHVCHYCGGPATVTDHVIPKALGGTDHPTNLVAACGPCNSRKGARVLTRRES
jgi:5-methylcytosine-specific restriction endonuclease McrA